MRRFLEWVWNHGILSTFLTGLFAVLPLALTVAIVTWVVRFLHGWVGTGSLVGHGLARIGVKLTYNAISTTIAYLIGWTVVLAGIWALGLLLKTTAKNRVEKMVSAVVDRIPVISSVYSTAKQLVGMIRKDESTDLQGMSAVYCSFGEKAGAGFLALLTTPEVYRFADRDCHVVYVPTSPVPMTGGIIFVPVDTCTLIEMSAEEVMRVYLSLGILAPQVVPAQYQTAVSPASDK